MVNRIGRRQFLEVIGMGTIGLAVGQSVAGCVARERRRTLYFGDAHGYLGPRGLIAAPPGLALDLLVTTPVNPAEHNRERYFAAIADFRARLATEPGLAATRIVLDIHGIPDFEVDPPELAAAGIKVVMPWFKAANRFGSGWMNLGVGLTPPGELILWRIKAAGQILDLAHAGHATARDALAYCAREIPELPVMGSHTGCYGVFPHPRNLPDDVMRAVADRGGVVGISTLTFILHQETDDAEPFIKHLRHAIKVCGIDAVCIGSDNSYAQTDDTAFRARQAELIAKLDPEGALGVRFPEEAPLFSGPQKMLRISELLERRLRDVLPSEDARERILGGNLRRFFAERLPSP